MHYHHHPAVLIHPAALFGAVFLSGVVLHLFFPLTIGDTVWLRVVGGVLFALAVLLHMWARGIFQEHHEDMDPTTPTRQLLLEGPYRYTRNPLYLSAIIALFAIALVINSWWLAAALVISCFTIHYGIVLREEKYLEARFGDHYRKYKKRVSRWV